jgi:nucleolar GTP-binding protein
VALVVSAWPKKAKKEERERESSQIRSHSRINEPTQIGLKDEKAIKLTAKMGRKEQGNWSRGHGAGEGDQRKSVHLVKWMNTGKKRMGTHYCR